MWDEHRRVEDNPDASNMDNLANDDTAKMEKKQQKRAK